PSALASRARRLARYEEVIARHRQGTSARALAAATGLSRATVNKFVQAGDFPERAPRAAGATHLTPFLDYRRERWASGCQNASLLWRELRERGFRGALSAVPRYLRSWRRIPRRSHHVSAAPSPGPATAVRASPRATCWLLLADPARLTEAEQHYLTTLCRLSPQVALAQALAREFHTVIRERDVPGLYQWLHGAKLSGITELISVANGIWRDRLAVEAALTHAESQGQTEGQVNRLKTIKRCGYGRAAFDLLRRRVLLAS
ncbi:MAG: transposase, partial [Chloroflexota bacterium]